jgi:hypothetical protein
MNLLLDSGAFSAWSRGGRVDLDQYIACIKRNQHHLVGYFNLDLIGGKDGQREYDAEVLERTAAVSYTNLQRMKDANLRPIAVFHRGEHPRWLERMLKDNESVIALSPGRFDHLAKTDWLDFCASLLMVNGRFVVRVHVLGTAAPAIAHQHPWTSMDATTWLEGPGNGNILVPNALEDTAWDTVPISNGRRRTAGNHFDYRPAAEQDRIRAHVESLGYEMQQVRHDAEARRAIYIRAYLIVQKRTGCVIYFVTNLGHHGEREILDQHGVEERLINYYDLQNQTDDALERYVTNNLRPTQTRRSSWKRLSYNARMDARKLAVYNRKKAYERDPSGI